MALPKIPAVTISALLVFFLLPVTAGAQYFGASYVSEKEGSRFVYYCLRTDEGKIYQRFEDWVQKAKEEKGYSALTMDSMIQIIAFDPETRTSLHLNYIFGHRNVVGIYEDSIQLYVNGVDSTQIRPISMDSVEIMWLSDADSDFLGKGSRYPVHQTIVLNDTSLPAIHPINIKCPEIRHLPSAIITGNTTWRLDEVFYDKDRIDGMLSVLYRDDFHPSTEADFNKMLAMSGMNKQEWWAYIRKMAEEREQKK